MFFINRKSLIARFVPVLLLLGGMFAAIISEAVYASAFTVTNTNDSGPGSLRQVIMEATPGDTINFDPALAGQTITLGSELVISKNLTIDGSGLNPRVAISGGGTVRILTLGSRGAGENVTLRSLILKNGNTDIDYGGAIVAWHDSILNINDVTFIENTAPQGGAIQAFGFSTVTISQSEFISNSADGSGGAIYFQTPIHLTSTKTKFTNNRAGNGGAIYLEASGGVVLEENVFENNSASYSGGAISSLNSPGVGLKIQNNLFSGNSAGSSGGAISIIRLSSTFVILENNTFYENRAANFGGAISSEASVEMRNNTFSHNQATNGGASVNLTIGGVLHKLYNNIFANSAGGVECLPSSSTLAVTGNNNLVEDGFGACKALPGTIISDPMLGPLADNGGSTHTMSLLAGSPAIDAGDSLHCPATDQRGYLRPAGSGCDIGAYEYSARPPTPTNTPTVTPTPTLTFTPTPTTTFTPTATPPYSYHPLLLSFTSNRIIGGVAVSDEDIVGFDGQQWILYFDGSDVGVENSYLSAFSIIYSDTILMSFNSDVTVNGITATPQDVLMFNAHSLGDATSGNWSLYFDGSDAGLDTASERIDSLSQLPDGRLLISTTGNPSIPGLTTSKDEDVLAFTPASLGESTNGEWSIFFDGSDVDLGESNNEDIDVLDVDLDGYIYLSTVGDFAVNGLEGSDEDVFVCVPQSLGDLTACNYLPNLYFDGSTWGLSSNDVDAFNFLLVVDRPVPIVTGTATPTATPTRLLLFTLTTTVTSTPTPP